jgi:hypothetical protein
MWDRHAQIAAQFNGGSVPHNDPAFIEASQGIIGPRATTSICSELQFIVELPQYEDIIKDPKGTPVPGKADLQMLLAYHLAGLVKVDHLAECVAYMDRKEMPKDMQVTFVSSLLRRNYAGFVNEAPMVAWIAKNAAWLSLVQALATS